MTQGWLWWAQVAATPLVVITFLASVGMMLVVRAPERRQRCRGVVKLASWLAAGAPLLVAFLNWPVVSAHASVLTMVNALLVWWTAVMGALSQLALESRVWRNASSTRGDGKIAVVTGGNRGIGFHTAMHLAQRGVTVILACRSEKTGKAAAAQINAAVGREAASAVALDLASLDSVRTCASVLLASVHGKLHLLVNNGGFLPPKGSRTKEGYEAGLGAMHFGHFLLTHLLEPVMLQTGTADDPARVIYVASAGHTEGRLHRTMYEGDGEGDLRGERVNGEFRSYARAKLANVLHARELTRRWAERGIKNLVAHSCHPGGVATDIWNAVPWPGSALFNTIGKVMLRPPASAGLQVAGMCLDPAWGRHSGWYADTYVEPEGKTSALGADPRAAAALWAISEVAVGLVPRGKNHVTTTLAAFPADAGAGAKKTR